MNIAFDFEGTSKYTERDQVNKVEHNCFITQTHTGILFIQIYIYNSNTNWLFKTETGILFKN